ncbi:Modification methylase BanI (M.BanI) (Cytosine-specific methyltransferase BanI) [Durusdinium trenchii]|uniref:Modification methylase BanI (M.BanI) (Cytosine-specific methyltransferase BanI) n=1 Tax=Durusdinium trenchii TaxID=1381693 RepID=A0ABP0QNB2_9DINO
MSSDEEFGVSDDEPGVAKEIFESSDDGGEAAVPALGNQLCCEQEFFSSSDESTKPESSCQTGKKEVVARSASKRAYTNRRSRTGAARFLGKPVCLQALRRLLAIGTSTLDKLRHSQVAFTGRSARPKHPIFGFCLDGEASAKWHSVAVFLWHIYHSSAEFMPSNLRLPRGRKETPEPFDRATVDGDDQDFSVRYVSKVLSELHEYSADINVKMLGPGGDDVPKRWLQHSNRTELYHEYVAYSEANNLKPASYSTFLKVVNCVMKLLAGSVSTSVLTCIQDGMDQAKNQYFCRFLLLMCALGVFRQCCISGSQEAEEAPKDCLPCNAFGVSECTGMAKGIKRPASNRKEAKPKPQVADGTDPEDFFASSDNESVRDRAEQGSAHESPEILLYSSSDEERQTHPKQKGKPSRADANRADDGGDDPDADLTTLPAWPADMEFGVRHSFLCENDKQKLRFLNESFPDADHIFHDMVEVSKGRAKDFKLGGQYTTVPEVDGVVSGFPCVSVSALNMCAKSFKDTSGATGCGWKSVRDFMKRNRPGFAVLENVKTLTHTRAIDDYTKPVDMIMKFMAGLGYECMYEVVNSTSYGLPQSRTRCWMIFIRLDSFQALAPRSPDSLLSTFQSFRLQPCALQKLLLDGNDLEDKSSHRTTQHKAKGLKWHEKFETACGHLGKVSWL